MAGPDRSRLKLTIDLDATGFQVGDIMLRWSDNANPLGYYPVPIVSFKSGPGPTVMVLGGTHGDEFEGPAAILRLAEHLRQAQFSGQIILLPAFNAPALAASSRVSPLDDGNLNRAFPGHANGGPTAMLAHFLETELIPKCDAVIDLHSGGQASVFAACALATQTSDRTLCDVNFALARVFGLPLIWALGEHNDNRSVNAAAERCGIPMIAAELGGGGGVDPVITGLAFTGLQNCLVHLGCLNRDLPNLPAPRCVEIKSPLHSIYAPSDGLFDRAVCAGQEVAAGDSAGDLVFPLEPARNPLQLRTKAGGIVLAHSNRGIVKRGELLVLLAQDCDVNL